MDKGDEKTMYSNGGLADDLRKRDGILCETGVRVQGTKGVGLQPIAPIKSFQTKFADQTGGKNT